MHKLHGSDARLLITIIAALSIALSGFGETPISDPVIARGASWQAAPDSATDGRDFLLTWVDGRSGRAAVYATRVAEDGSLLNPEGILLSDSFYAASSPSVAWTGSSYIVVWQQIDGCWSRRIERDGRIDATRMLLEGGCSGPRVAGANGMAIVGARNYGSIKVAIIESTGVVRPMEPAYGGPLDVACTRSECWLVWESYGSVTGRRLGRDGEKLADDRILATEAMSPRIAAAGDRFLLTWRERMDYGVPSRRIWAQELDAESQLDGPSQFRPFGIAESTKPVLRDARVASSGRGFIVAWSQEREQAPIDRRPTFRSDDVAYVPQPQMEIRARRFGDGEDEPLMIAQSNVARYEPPSITSNGLTHLSTWIEQDSRKITAGFSKDGASFARIPVTLTATAQSEPHVVTCGDHLLVVWAEERDDGKYSILARRFRLSGEALDVHPIVIASTPGSQHRPVAAFDGDSYLVAWHEDQRVYARRLHRDGTLAPDVLSLSGNSTDEPPAVVGTDRGFAVLHGDGRQLILTRIGGSSVERTSIADSHDRAYAIAWTGSELVVGWSDYRNHVYAQRLSSAGALLGAQILVGFGVRSATSLSIACGPSDCVAAWGEILDGVKAALIVNGSAYLLGEPIPDVPYYLAQSTARFRPTVVRTDGGFKVIAYGPNGALYVRPVRDGIALSESVLGEPHIENEDYAVTATPQGLVTVHSRSVSGPGYAGARRLFLQRTAP
jgi:hypothetical protein